MPAEALTHSLERIAASVTSSLAPIIPDSPAHFLIGATNFPVPVSREFPAKPLTRR